MKFLSTYEAKQKIAEEVSHVSETLQVVSAFCKLPAIMFLDEKISHPLKSKKIMVRFLLSDLVQGASDFGLYEYCKTNGWEMYVRFDLHAKTYIFDRKRCILGSANLTPSGMGLSLHGNYELSSFADVDQEELKKIDLLFDNAILMTDELYASMKIEYEASLKKCPEKKTNMRWGDQIERRFNPKIDVLFTYDFPTSDLPNFSDVNSFEFLNVNFIPSIDELRQLFRWSKAFLWLYNYVSTCQDKTAYFGGATAALHNALINDPAPYRREVKQMLANTLGWVKALDMPEICIDVPNHSQRIRIM